MKTRELGRSGLKVSALGFGCMGISFGYANTLDQAAGVALIRAAFDDGVTFFDTAEVYGPWINEEVVGAAVAPFKDKVVIATKFGFNIDPDTGAMHGTDSSPARIRRVCEASLKRLGVGVALDDFGTGYSSLGYLTRMPVEILKIDRSFVLAMLEDPAAMTLVSTIISLAHALRLTVVAEGVESEEQAKILRLLRCDQMQGYLISQPLDFEAMTAFLRRPPG